MTLLARLIGREEGFGIPGTVPTRMNNPGDLRHAPNAEHPGDPDAIGLEPTADDGWADLERQLRLYADRRMTLRAMVYAFAPPEENDSEAYLNFICGPEGLNCTPDTLVADALKIP